MNSVVPFRMGRSLHPRPSISPCPQVGPPSSSSEVTSLSVWACAEQALFLSVVQYEHLYISVIRLWNLAEVGTLTCLLLPKVGSFICPPLFYKPRIEKLQHLPVLGGKYLCEFKGNTFPYH